MTPTISELRGLLDLHKQAMDGDFDHMIEDNPHD